MCHTARHTNKRSRNKKSWGGAPADQDLLAQGGGRRPGFLQTRFLSPQAGGRAAKTLYFVPGPARGAGTRNRREAGSKKRFLNPVLDCILYCFSSAKHVCGALAPDVDIEARHCRLVGREFCFELALQSNSRTAAQVMLKKLCLPSALSTNTIHPILHLSQCLLGEQGQQSAVHAEA